MESLAREGATMNPMQREWKLAAGVLSDKESADMKAPCAFLILLLTTVTAIAEFKFPAGVFRVAQLDEAMNEAAKQRKPLFVVHGDENHTPDHQDLLRELLKAGSDWSVTVFISLKEEFSMPPLLLSGRSASPPMAFICSPESDKIWKVIAEPHNPSVEPVTPSTMRKHVRREIEPCKPEIAAWFAAKPPHGPELPGNKKLIWPHADGKSAVQGIFGKVEDGKLYYRNSPDTPETGTPLTDFHPATVRYVRYISGAGTRTKETEPPAPALEKWTNAQGKALEAAFIRLKDGKVTLRTAAGKEHTLALDSLSAESQARARQLAGGGTKKD